MTPDEYKAQHGRLRDMTHEQKVAYVRIVSDARYDEVRRRFTALWARADEIDAPYDQYTGRTFVLSGPGGSVEARGGIDIRPATRETAGTPCWDLRHSQDWGDVARALGVRRGLDNGWDPDQHDIEATGPELFRSAYELSHWSDLLTRVERLERELDQVQASPQATEEADND